MTQTDQQKVISKGFTIIRSDMYRLAIKHKKAGAREWITLESGFTSKAAVERRMKELLLKKNIIED